MHIFLTRFFTDRSATTAIEYALVASGIAIVIVAGVNALRDSIVAKFELVSTSLK